MDYWYGIFNPNSAAVITSYFIHFSLFLVHFRSKDVLLAIYGPKSDLLLIDFYGPERVNYFLLIP